MFTTRKIVVRCALREMELLTMLLLRIQVEDLEKIAPQLLLDL